MSDRKQKPMTPAEVRNALYRNIRELNPDQSLLEVMSKSEQVAAAKAPLSGRSRRRRRR